MRSEFLEIIKNSIGTDDIIEKETIQNLWSGYGKILRYGSKEKISKSVVVKNVRFPKNVKSSFSHNRKIKSYQVEMSWYENYASVCNDFCRVPHALALSKQDDEVLIVLEDLDLSGYPKRIASLSWKNIEACLSWLAYFHALYIESSGEGLWKSGTYWHLETRPEEFAAMRDSNLKKAAFKIDKILENCKIKTIIHGDAKTTNFCFSKDESKVAAVDFQYVGMGCPMKDVAYFADSALSQRDCEKYEERILSIYFENLEKALKFYNLQYSIQQLENCWRPLYKYAWADFYRFLKGWAPGLWGDTSYGDKVALRVANQELFNSNRDNGS